MAASAAGLVLPDGALRLGDEIAHGSNGMVHEATLFGVSVCAKVSPCDCIFLALVCQTP
jgi:hypothetical protein